MVENTDLNQQLPAETVLAAEPLVWGSCAVPWGKFKQPWSRPTKCQQHFLGAMPASHISKILEAGGISQAHLC